MVWKQKRIAIFILLGGALLTVLFLRFSTRKETSIVQQPSYDATLYTNAVSVPVTIADTNEERELGLSFSKSLIEGTGKFFIFPNASAYGFWMKDMNYSLDIIWIDKDMKIVGIADSVSPDSYPRVFYAPSPVQYVLEINAGESKKLGLMTGTSFMLRK